MVDLGSIYSGRQAGFDISAALNFLNNKRALELRAQELQIQKQQAAFDREFDMQTRELRIEEMTLRNSLLRQEEKTSREEADALGAMTAAMRGVASAIPENPTIEDLANVARNLPQVESGISRFLPTSLRNAFKKTGGAEQVLSAPILDAIGSNLARGDLDTAAAIRGQNEFADPIQRFATDEMQGAAMSLGRRALSGFKSAVSAIPGTKYIEDRLSFGTVPEMLGKITGMQAELVSQTTNLAHPLFNDPELKGDREEAGSLAAEKLRELERLHSSISAGHSVLAGGNGVVTTEQRDGVDTILKSDVNNLFRQMNPGDAVVTLGDHLKAARYWPSNIVGPVFEAAIRSADPMSQFKASLVYDELEARYEHTEKSPFREELSKYGPLYDKLKTMSMIRKSIGPAIEAAAFGAPEDQRPQAVAVYVLQVQAATDAALLNAERLRQTVKSAKQAEDTAKDLPESIEGSNRAIAFQNLGNPGGSGLVDWFTGTGVLDALDVGSPSDLPIELVDEYFVEMNHERYEPNYQPSESSRAEIAGSKIAHNWHRGWLEPELITRMNPVHIARAQGKPDMPMNVVNQVARYQLKTELLDTIKTKDGQPANVRIDDVRAIPVMDREGIAYRIQNKQSGEIYGIWRPDYSNEALDLVWEETKGFMLDGGNTFHAAVWQPLNRYLGDANPTKRAAAEAENLRRREAMREEAEQFQKRRTKERLEFEAEMRRKNLQKAKNP